MAVVTTHAQGHESGFLTVGVHAMLHHGEKPGWRYDILD